MVRVKGQLADSPLLDIGAVKQEYWQRKEVLLPSLAKLMPKKKGWFGRSKDQAPKIVIRRLTEQEWRDIDERFYDHKVELVKNKAALTNLTQKLLDKKTLSKDEYSVINAAQTKAMPIYKGMLEVMIEEPQMTYTDVSAMMDILDDYDRNTLTAYVNLLTSQKAESAKRILDERNQELDQIQAKVGAY
jgi:deoxyhypusine synthase